MSRIGKQPIAIPAKVKVELKGQQVTVEGPKGKLNLKLPPRTTLTIEKDKVLVGRQGDDAQARPSI
jgi:large subunit ribosomal protein L6